MELSLFDTLPFWVIALVSIIVLLVALEAGYRVGLARREIWRDADTGGGAIVQTTMFAILGLVLAFTYASVVSRYDARKQAIPVEANVLSTAFQRADIVVEPGRTELKKVLLDYARTRYFPPDLLQNSDGSKAALLRTLKQQAKIWPATKRVIEMDNPATMETSLVEVINSVFDAHTTRFAAALDTLPKIVMWMLLFVAAASLSVAGFNAGIQGRMSRWRMTTLTLVLTGLMLIILDFDRPLDGAVIVNQQSLNSVIAAMEADLKQ